MESKLSSAVWEAVVLEMSSGVLEAVVVEIHLMIL
jgi:hypothetical protein